MPDSAHTDLNDPAYYAYDKTKKQDYPEKG